MIFQKCACSFIELFFLTSSIIRKTSFEKRNNDYKKKELLLIGDIVDKVTDDLQLSH